MPLYFQIVIMANGRRVRLNVTASNDGHAEIHVVTGANGSVTLKNDLPALQKAHIKKLHTWMQIEGRTLSAPVYKAIVDAIEQHYNPPPKPRPRPTWTPNPSRREQHASIMSERAAQKRNQ